MSDRYLMKFWHTGRKCFVDFDNEGLYINYNNGQIYTRSGSLNVTEHYIRLQCTGLRDKNGALIFEGDLISAFNDVEICLVSFEDGGFIVSNKKYINVHISQDYLDKCSYKVIGNVHEHTELVEGYESKT